MLAAVLEAINQPLAVLDDIEPPDLEAGQALVEIICTSLCYSQIMELHGKRGPDQYLPHLLGHEAAGRVLKIGAQVNSVKVGDRVIIGWVRGIGLDGPGIKYFSRSMGYINAGGAATFAEKAVVYENRLTLMPDDMDFEIASLFGCAAITGAGAVQKLTKIDKDSSVAVIGLGGVGLCALLALRSKGPRRIFAIDCDRKKLELSDRFGASDCISTDNSEWVKFSTEHQFDFVIEASGRSHLIEQAFRMTRPRGGKCIFLSHPANGEKLTLDPLLFLEGRELIGSSGGNCIPQVDIPDLWRLLKPYQQNLKELVGSKYKLEEINDAFLDLEQRRAIRPMLVIKPDSLGA